MELSAVERVLHRHSHLFRRAYIYGSVARGDQDEHSDVDVILIRETTLPSFDRVREVFDIVFALTPLDILIYTEEEIEFLLKDQGRYFLKDGVAKGVRIEGTQGRGAQVAPAGRE